MTKSWNQAAMRQLAYKRERPRMHGPVVGGEDAKTVLRRPEYNFPALTGWEHGQSDVRDSVVVHWALTAEPTAGYARAPVPKDDEASQELAVAKIREWVTQGMPVADSTYVRLGTWHTAFSTLYVNTHDWRAYQEASKA